jgi:tetratricopeptide (TPR) repeat protein
MWRRWGRRAGPQGQEQMTLEELVNESMRLLDAQEPTKAKALALRAIEREPDTSEAWINLGYAELQLGNLSAALDASSRATRIDPMNPLAWHNLGEAHARMGNGAEALKCNDRALSLDQANALFWLGRGEALGLLERWKEAAASFDKALRLDPSMEAARINRGVMLLRSDPVRDHLLLVTLGAAVQREEGKIDDTTLLNIALGEAIENSAADEDLVRGFDCFAEVNLQRGEIPEFLKYFCFVNMFLAQYLKNDELIELSTKRWTEAVVGKRLGGAG